MDKQKEGRGGGKERIKEVSLENRWMFSFSQKKPWGRSSAKPTSYALGNRNSDKFKDLSELKQLVNSKAKKVIERMLLS